MKRSKRSGFVRLFRRLAILLIVTSLSAIETASRAHPAGAEDNGNVESVGLVSSPEIMSRFVNGYDCLDSNYAGFVYVLPCTNDNDFQRWRHWFGGWIKNVETGLCLTLLPGWELGARDCDYFNRYQYWEEWNTGWIRNPNDGVCVERYRSWNHFGMYVRANGCNSDPDQMWTHVDS